MPAKNRKILASSAVDNRAAFPGVRSLLTKLPKGSFSALLDGDVDADKLAKGDVFRLRLQTPPGSWGTKKTKRFRPGSYAECEVVEVYRETPKSEVVAFYRVKYLVEPVDPDNESAIPVNGVVLDPDADPEETSNPHETAMKSSEFGARLGQMIVGDAAGYFQGDALAYFASRLWQHCTKETPIGTLSGRLPNESPAIIQLTEDVYF